MNEHTIPSDYCEWKHIKPDDPDYWGSWKTECGKTWPYSKELKKIGMKFCFNCGKEIKEVSDD